MNIAQEKPLRKRDSQRAKVYAWEREAVPLKYTTPIFEKVEQAAEWLRPIWAKERGRVGLAGKAAPLVQTSSWGQRSALAHVDHRITLPRWARSQWVVLHEAAHLLAVGDRHGPRFVGVLIGLACRHIDMDANLLMAAANEHGVKYHVRTIGTVPVHGTAWHVEQAIANEGPMSEVDIAAWLDIGCGVSVTPIQVRGTALSMIRHGKSRWLRKKLVLLDGSVQPLPHGH